MNKNTEYINNLIKKTSLTGIIESYTQWLQNIASF